MFCPIANVGGTVHSRHWHQEAGRQTESGVPVTGLQHFVPQSSFFSHFGLQANAPVWSNVEQASPSQQWRVPPQG